MLLSFSRTKWQPGFLVGVFALTALFLYTSGGEVNPLDHPYVSNLFLQRYSTAGIGGDDASTNFVPSDRLTKYVKGIAGVTVWENLYFFEGVFYAVTPEALPIAPRFAIRGAATGKPGQFGNSDEVLKAITPEEAPSLLGLSVVKKHGFTMFFNDHESTSGPGFLNHYYHFGEAFLCGWRLAASAYTQGILPTRLLFKEQPQNWRDRAGLNRWIQLATMPNAIIEDGPLFQDMAQSHMGFVFEKVVMVDRVIAHAWGGEPQKWNKMTGNLPSVEATRDWWTPLRDNLKTFLLAQGCDPSRKDPRVPVVTYINRQSTTRRLTDEDHKGLVEALTQLDKEGVIEFTDAQMEHLHRNTQFCQALRTDIMIGVHGNGLSHQLWMRPGGGVIEIMAPPGFAMDYALPAKLMNHAYFSIHNDTVLSEDQWTDSEGNARGQGDNFHALDIPVHGRFIGDLVRQLARNLSSIPDEW